MANKPALRVCGVCEGARWIVAHNGRPFHGTEGGGTPCPECNDSDTPQGYRPTCLACVTLEVFMAAYPDDDDVILTQLEQSLGDIPEPSDVTDYTKVGSATLMLRKEQLTSRLTHLGELNGQRTPEGAQVHSELAACVMELRHRKML